MNSHGGNSSQWGGSEHLAVRAWVVLGGKEGRFALVCSRGWMDTNGQDGSQVACLYAGDGTLVGAAFLPSNLRNSLTGHLKQKFCRSDCVRFL